MRPTSMRQTRANTSRPGSGTPTSKGDRKSTRLNSSHGYISYAVFCLKKKKNNARRQSEPHDASLLRTEHILRARPESPLRAHELRGPETVRELPEHGGRDVGLPGREA